VLSHLTLSNYILGRVGSARKHITLCHVGRARAWPTAHSMARGPFHHVVSPVVLHVVEGGGDGRGHVKCLIVCSPALAPGWLAPYPVTSLQRWLGRARGGERWGNDS
jgi:hypothetical protein